MLEGERGASTYASAGVVPLTWISQAANVRGAGRQVMSRLPKTSELVGAMDRHNAIGEVAHFHTTEAGALHHALQSRLVGVLAD